MKPVIMFTTSWCPYCKSALSLMDEILSVDSRYASIDIKVIDEELQPEISKQYDYYYVPTYYVDGIKVHEGAASEATIRGVFEKACK